MSDHQNYGEILKSEVQKYVESTHEYKYFEYNIWPLLQVQSEIGLTNISFSKINRSEVYSEITAHLDMYKRVCKYHDLEITSNISVMEVELTAPLPKTVITISWK